MIIDTVNCIPVSAGMKKTFAQPDQVEYVKRVSSSKYGIDLSQRPKDDTVGSFRKLAVDWHPCRSQTAVTERW